jgi:hypothetical protein
LKYYTEYPEWLQPTTETEIDESTGQHDEDLDDMQETLQKLLSDVSGITGTHQDTSKGKGKE